jgi:hypothetical protein
MAGVHALIKELGEQDAEALRVAGYRRAEELLVAHKRKVEELAGVLAECKEMDQTAIEQILP